MNPDEKSHGLVALLCLVVGCGVMFPLMPLMSMLVFVTGLFLMLVFWMVRTLCAGEETDEE